MYSRMQEIVLANTSYYRASMGEIIYVIGKGNYKQGGGFVGMALDGVQIEKMTWQMKCKVMWSCQVTKVGREKVLGILDIFKDRQENVNGNGNGLEKEKEKEKGSY